MPQFTAQLCPELRTCAAGCTKMFLSLGTRADKSLLRERFLVMLCIRSSITCSRLNVIGRDPNAHIDGDDRSKRLERI